MASEPGVRISLTLIIGVELARAKAEPRLFREASMWSIGLFCKKARISWKGPGRD
jgi:hypothetical protein